MGKSQKTGIMRIFQALLVSYAITALLLLVLAVLLYKLNLDKGKVSAGIIGIYVVSAFAGGFLLGKLQKVRKFIWGLVLGILYFLLLLLVSFGVYHTLQGDVVNLLTTLVLCSAGGMLGGMFS
ncbi:TIGR04086 family membrane protein [Sellimonas caecigallum]|uniref:TIGR04086 family membrane protein n=1 Tax=Sellimonas caecigallum TaxID=2592333 RepID=A0ABS7L428_9FIRM|nr:TIGR04086 family membrane protein [Sellimonas caecigallum]MBY0757791.1 TIGR04086 family membrane protein [Sellimonas caecigallum]